MGRTDEFSPSHLGERIVERENDGGTCKISDESILELYE